MHYPMKIFYLRHQSKNKPHIIFKNMKTPIVKIDEEQILEMHSIICEELTLMLIDRANEEDPTECACLKCLSGRAMTKTLEYLKDNDIVEVRLTISPFQDRRHIN